MISVDTEVIRELVSVCSAANDSINDAVDALNRVTSHNDWNCKERDAINDYTSQNKSKIRVLQENSQSFLNALTAVSHDFENAEKSISVMFSSLDGLIGSVISVPTTINPGYGGSGIEGAVTVIAETIIPQNVGPGGVLDITRIRNALSNIINLFDESLLTQNPLANSSLANILDSISICNFGDMVFGGGR